MADSTFTSSNNYRRMNRAQQSSPFATPVPTPTESPTVPEPVAHPSRPSRPSQPAELATPKFLYRDANNEEASYAYKSDSMSSADRSSSMTPISSIDLEKTGRRGSDPKMRHKTGRDRPRHDRIGGDPEKGGHNRPCNAHHWSERTDSPRLAYLAADESDDARHLQEEKALKILCFLSGPCVLLSLLNAMWTFISLLIVTLALPVRICAKRPTFGQQLGGLLGPALNLQLKSIYTPLPPQANEDATYNPGMLLIVQLLSPFLSLGMMLAAWVATIYWMSSAAVGDPSGTDKRDDGMETVLSLRDWWEQWLVKSVQEE